MILRIFVRSLFETRSFAKCIEFPKVLLTQGQNQNHYDLQRVLTEGSHLILVRKHTVKKTPKDRIRGGTYKTKKL